MPTARETEPTWSPHFPYGFADAIQTAGSTAAPVLAGFSFALIPLILPRGEFVRWQGVALALLVVAAISFISALQFAFTAQMWIVKPSEIAEWKPQYTTRQQVAVQWLHKAGFARWFRRFQWAYRVGITTLLEAESLSPSFRPAGSGTSVRTRLVAIFIAAFGLAAELLWIAANLLVAGRPVGVFRPQPDSPATCAGWLRRNTFLRWLARRVVPLIEVDPPAKRVAAAAPEALAPAVMVGEILRERRPELEKVIETLLERAKKGNSQAAEALAAFVDAT